MSQSVATVPFAKADTLAFANVTVATDWLATANRPACAC